MSTLIEPFVQRYGESYRWRVAGTVMLGALSTVMAATSVNIALPNIMSGFGIGQDAVQWMSTGFLAAAAATMLATAWCVTNFGQRNTYIGALALFIIGTLAAGLAPSYWVLVAGRVAQGAASGILQPLAMTTLFQVFPATERGRAMSIYGLGIVLAPGLGPAAGGLLVDHFDWRAVFFLLLPVAAASLALVPRYVVGRDPDACPRRFDALGFVLLAFALVAILAGMSRLHDGASALTLGLLLGGIAAALVFVVWQLRHNAPLIDLGIFAEKRFVAASVVSFAYGMGIFGSVYLAPLFVQTIARYSPSQAGLLLVPGGLVLALVVPLAGRLADRHAPHRVVMAGMCCFSASFLMFAAAVGHSSFTLLALLVVLGRIGLGLIIPGLSSGAMRAAPSAFVAHVPGTVSFARQLGGAVGVNLIAILLESRTLALCGAGPCAPAFRDSFLALAIVFGASLLPAWRMGR